MKQRIIWVTHPFKMGFSFYIFPELWLQQSLFIQLKKMKHRKIGFKSQKLLISEINIFSARISLFP